MKEIFELLTETQIILIVLFVFILGLVAAFIATYNTKRNLTAIGKDMHVSSSYDEQAHYERGLKDALDGLRAGCKSEAYLDGYSDGNKMNLS